MTDPILSRQGAWHQSTLETLLDGCSWQYMLSYALMVPQPLKAASVTGTAYHAAVEAYETARHNGLILLVDDLVRIAKEYVETHLDDNPVAAAEAACAVRHWYSTPVKGGPSHREWLQDYKMVALEPYFKMPLVEDALPIAGSIDGVYVHKKTGMYTIVDHKTANNLSRWGYDGALHRAQATMYSVALLLSPDYPNINTLLPMSYLVARKSVGKGHSFEGARRVIVQPGFDDVEKLGNRIRYAENIVKQESYTVNTAWTLCSPQWCAYYQGCQVDGSLAGTPQEVRLRVSQKECL